MNRNVKTFLGLNMVIFVIVGGFISVSLFGLMATKALAQDATPAVTAPDAAPVAATRPRLSEAATVAAFWSAAVATSVACVAAGIAVGMTGSAAIGAVAERPEIMGRTILFVVFGEGLAIYGLAIAFIILMKV